MFFAETFSSLPSQSVLMFSVKCPNIIFGRYNELQKKINEDVEIEMLLHAKYLV